MTVRPAMELLQGLFLLLCIGVGAYTFRPRRHRTAPPAGARVRRVARRSQGAPRAPWLVVLASLIGRDVARLQQTLARSWRAMAFAWQQQQQGREIQPVTMSTPLLATTPDLGYEPLVLQPQKQETRNETASETDIKLGQKRVAGVVALAAAGMDEGQIWAVVQKEPAALVAALKLTAARNVAAVMEGATAANMAIIREIKEAAERPV